eukprot:Gb_13038 [translate_table: standard]
MRGDLFLFFHAVVLLGFVCNVVDGLGSMSTIAASYGSNGNGSAATVCGILTGGQGIECVRNNATVTVFPNVSFIGISGGNGFFCGLREGGLHLLCWDSGSGNSSLRSRRISKDKVLSDVVVGENHLCALRNGTSNTGNNVLCWRGNSASPKGHFDSITAGARFTCGISENDTVRCWGLNGSENQAPRAPNDRMQLVVAGGYHVCGIRNNGVLACWGRNDSGQSNPPSAKPYEFVSLALGEHHTCGIRRINKTVVCWGRRDSILGYPEDENFESIVAGDNFTCGLVSGNFSVLCWGQGFESGIVLPLPPVLPGSCSSTQCTCGIYPNSESFCSNSRHVCVPCSESPSGFISRPPISSPSPSPFSPPSIVTTRRVINKGLLAFAIVGSVGALSGLLTILWCIWMKFCTSAGPNFSFWCICSGGQGRVHNSVQPTVVTIHSASIRRQASRAMRRQRSGTSSNRSKRGDRAEEFSLAELETATNGFSDSNKIGAGSFGSVYRGKLQDGREVAIKRGDIVVTKKFQEKETAFQSELAFLSRLHHKHLVSLIGFCEEGEERMLVYEYMPNGALYDHLHKRTESSSLLHSWTTRIKIALDAARGIEYLHTYAVPPIIHRDIKSSNILLDGTWAARVSDFGLSLMGPEVQDAHLSLMAAGTVGYMDPEYYGLQHLTTKSDVYGFGVVLLEILTGQRAIHKQSGGPISVVDFAVPRIVSDELHLILDSRVRPPQSHEIEAVELVAYTAVHCVNLEGKDRPSMTDIVANLERAVAICTPVSISRSASTVVTSDDAQ